MIVISKNRERIKPLYIRALRALEYMKAHPDAVEAYTSIYGDGALEEANRIIDYISRDLIDLERFRKAVSKWEKWSYAIDPAGAQLELIREELCVIYSKRSLTTKN